MVECGLGPQRPRQRPLTYWSGPLALVPLAVVTSGPCTVFMVSAQTTELATALSISFPFQTQSKVVTHLNFASIPLFTTEFFTLETIQ